MISCDFSEFCTYIDMHNYLMLPYAANTSKMCGFFLLYLNNLNAHAGCWANLHFLFPAEISVR